MTVASINLAKPEAEGCRLKKTDHSSASIPGLYAFQFVIRLISASTVTTEKHFSL
jgi:hypothetical protein